MTGGNREEQAMIRSYDKTLHVERSREHVYGSLCLEGKGGEV